MATSVGARVPIDPHVLEQAADWLMQLHSGAASAQLRRECERWRASDPEHARAWQRAEALLGKLGGLPPELAMPALDRSRELERTSARRAALLKLAALLAVVPGAWLLMEQRAGATITARLLASGATSPCRTAAASASIRPPPWTCNSMACSAC